MLECPVSKSLTAALALLLIPAAIGCTNPDPAQASAPPEPASEVAEPASEIDNQVAQEASATAEVEAPAIVEADEAGQVEEEPAAEPTTAVAVNAAAAGDATDIRIAELLGQIRSDPEPEEIIRNSHYWVSNESSHFLFRDRVSGIGGAYMGVGTDQNYLIAGWARSEVIIMLDFDQQIANVHDLYGIAFANSTTPDEFLAIWGDEGDLRFETLVPAAVDADRASDLMRTFGWGGRTVFARLRRIVRQYNDLGIPTFMTTQEDFDYMKDLWARGRVVAVRGDLTGDLAIQDAAHALHELDVPLRAIYTSNAEQYFDFVPSFRRNMLVLPVDEQSVLLRTRPMSSLGLAPDDDYHYSIQPGPNLQMWMAGSSTSNAQRLMRQRSTTGVEGLSIIEAPLPADATTPAVAEAAHPADMAQTGGN
jgi:hypothetical protein